MSNQKRAIWRVHTIDAVYVGPTEPQTSMPPIDDELLGRASEWSFVELDNGDVVVTHVNPRAVNMAAGRDGMPHAPHGCRFVTRVPSANLRDVQYAHEPLPAPPAKAKVA